MDNKQYLIIVKGMDKTADIISCKYNRQINKYDITYWNDRVYSYNYDNVLIFENPIIIDPKFCKLYHRNKELKDITNIYNFRNNSLSYYHVCFKNKLEQSYPESELRIVKSVLNDVHSKSVFDYLYHSSEICTLEGENGVKLLPKQYEKIDFVGDDTALATYLNPSIQKKNESAKANKIYPIFPFGINNSQLKAVNNALNNQISVIEGPPGTGKTQTVLNIIANLVIRGKTVQVVSNNNAAIESIKEKLSSKKYQMGFIVAELGKSDNKIDFIMNQSGEYPNFETWEYPECENDEYKKGFRLKAKQLNQVFANSERLGIDKQELNDVTIEQKHFKQYLEENDLSDLSIKTRRRLKSSQIMRLWQTCQNYYDKELPLPFFFKFKSRFIYGVANWDFYHNSIPTIINIMQKLYYETKISELTRDISDVEEYLKNTDSQKKIDDFCDISMHYLKNALYHRYANRTQRVIFYDNDLWMNPEKVLEEYPVILSTTFSSRSSLSKTVMFDYVIMDEASQVDVSTGALALSSAINAVIVGDTKQLPNVLSDVDKQIAKDIFDRFKVDPSYNFAERSFLQSICDIIPNVPRTLLREHYRCHPKIINYCNQKFYDGQLIILTPDQNEDDVLSVVKTTIGNHARGHFNQRQIEVVKDEILPKLKNVPPDQIGIIAPYNDQVAALKKEIHNGIEIATVHKFQGREKDVIILTTVDNNISSFTDDPYLLNVAVSRAKKKLFLVVSGNIQDSESNIGDLISYVEYNKCSITESKLYSIFDYLYSQYTQKRFEYLKTNKRISEYDSENLMYVLITEVLKELHCSNWKVICHQPLKMLIRDPSLLSDEECKYVMNNSTHLDFLIFNHVSKRPVLAIEVDGFDYHKEGTIQAQRDKLKDHVLDLYAIPYLRFATNGSGEKQKLEKKLQEIINGFK